MRYTPSGLTYETSFDATTTEAPNAWSSAWTEVAVTGPGGNQGLLVNATSDALEVPYSGTFNVSRSGTYRLDAAGVPTGDQEVHATLTRVGNTTASVMLRMPGTANSGYVFGVGVGYATEVGIWRRVDGTDTLLANVAVSGNTHTVRCRAVGTNPVVLEMWEGDTLLLSYNDSNAARHTTGKPGVFGRQGGDSTADSGWVDDYSVFDVAALGVVDFEDDAEYTIPSGTAANYDTAIEHVVSGGHFQTLTYVAATTTTTIPNVQVGTGAGRSIQFAVRTRTDRYPTLVSATIGGEACEVQTVSPTAFGYGNFGMWAFCIKAPTVEGLQSLAVTFSGCTGQNADIAATVTVLRGADQTQDAPTAVIAQGTSGGVSSVAVSSAAGRMVVSAQMMMTDNTGMDNVVAAGFTIPVENGNPTPNGSTTGGIGYVTGYEPGAGTVTPQTTWRDVVTTVTDPQGWVAMGFDWLLVPAAGGISATVVGSVEVGASAVATFGISATAAVAMELTAAASATEELAASVTAAVEAALAANASLDLNGSVDASVEAALAASAALSLDSTVDASVEAAASAASTMVLVGTLTAVIEAPAAASAALSMAAVVAASTEVSAAALAAMSIDAIADAQVEIFEDASGALVMQATVTAETETTAQATAGLELNAYVDAVLEAYLNAIGNVNYTAKITKLDPLSTVISEITVTPVTAPVVAVPIVSTTPLASFTPDVSVAKIIPTHTLMKVTTTVVAQKVTTTVIVTEET